MDFLAYSDIHHDEYSNGVTEDDIVSVENQITQYALDNKVNKVLFLGDWFRATNPIRTVIAKAEACWKQRSDNGITTIVLVGNHDRSTKSPNSGHAFVSAEIFKNDLKNITVIDTACELDIDGIKFFCIPAGHENTDLVRNFNRDSSPLVVLFHGLVAGSALANGGSVAGGIHPDILRRFQANLALGGDNHTYQILDELLGYPSMYLGAPLCHNWGDRGQKRGFWHFEFNGVGEECPWNKVFVPTISPRFVRIGIEAKDDMQTICALTARLEEELEGSPGIVDIKLIGPNAKTINQDLIEDSLGGFKLRRLKILTDSSHERLEVAPGMAVADKPEDKWAAYIAHGNVPGMEGLRPSILAEMGKWALTKAKQEL